ncbi:MAG: DUF3369 domain-containing protein [bacterium]|nr:DUF3369 domain-containing protein [bacterium]
MPEKRPTDPRSADALEFAAEDAVVNVPGRPGEQRGGEPWKLLIVDDDVDVHHITQLVLGRYRFEGRGLMLLSAFSGAAARQVMREHPDIAVVLLDVVMEQEDSGLRLVRYLRNDVGNRHVRIILRTGQPGSAPEQEVVAEYDINDYKSKTELTADKLCTAVTSALRAWRDIRELERNRQGLQRVLDASGELFRWRSRDRFAAGLLDQQLSVLGERSTGGAAVGGLVARTNAEDCLVVAAHGTLAGSEGRRVCELDDGRLRDLVQRTRLAGELLVEGDACCTRCRDDEGGEVVCLVTGLPNLDRLDHDLLRLYVAHAGLAYRNIGLALEVIEGQKEMIHTLCGLVESRSKETANHVLRVGEMAHVLGLAVGMGTDDAAVLKLAAPLHDVGKVGIPDAILKKPGPLTPAETANMRRHAVIGHSILDRSRRRVMVTAARIALEHHERWDGCGYPVGLCAGEISLEGRITALVDVFDALVNRRVYRGALPLEEVVAILRAERGRQFDPRLVDVFLEHLDSFVRIVQEHPDVGSADQAEESPREARETA